MNDKEIGEIRRHLRRDRSNMTAIYGCYVNQNKEIISEFRESLGIMPENEAEKYFALLKRTLSGSIGKNLIDITFKTSQVAGSPEHQMLMDLRKTNLKDDELRQAFYHKVIESLSFETNYLILLGCDTYDVPFKSKDDETQNDSSEETYTYIVCAVCPVKETKPNLHYVPEEKSFHDGGMTQNCSAPELGFLFPAFDSRATNLYNALFYTRSADNVHEDFIGAVFHTEPPMAADDQKETFQALLSSALEERCSLDVVQTVHGQLCELIAEHKASREPEPLVITKQQVESVLESCGLEGETMEHFDKQFDEEFGADAILSPSNIVDVHRLEVTTPDVTIRVNPERRDLVETRFIGGTKYILIRADDAVEVNGVGIHIADDSDNI